MRALEVLAAGPRTLVEDLGRPGLAALGVGRSGAADRSAFRLGARLLGQDYDAAALELTLGGLTVRPTATLTVVLTGAPSPADVGGRAVAFDGPFDLYAGQVLRVHVPTVGVRAYVSVRGGIDLPPVLGSRSTDTLSGLGPPALRAGDVLPVGHPQPGFPVVDVAPHTPPSAGTLVVLASPGPRTDWLADPDALYATPWTASPQSDRIAVRLDGPPLARHLDHLDDELASEGVVRGSVQVPAGGRPLVFGSDHPVTGGYPVVAVVDDADVDRLSQAVPGQRIRFVRR